MAGIGDSSLSSFALTPEVEAELLQAFANDASTLARLREQIRRAKEADVVMKELMERREGLIRRNEELRQDAERGLNQAPIIPRASSPTAPHPRREQRLPSVLVTSAAAHDGRRASATAGGGRDDSCILRASPPLSASANELDAGFVLKEFDDHHFDASSAPVPNHWNASSAFRYAYRGPTVAGGVVSSVLRDATLFRVVCEDGSWAFYNDTRCYRMFVHYRLSAGSTVEAGPAATVSTLPSGEMDLSMDVLPEETKVLLTGRVTNFESLCEAIPLTRDDVGGKVSDDTPLKMLERIRQHHGPPTAALSSAEALDICVQHNLPFVDPEFLPSDLSLFRPSRDLFYIPSLKWNQPADFLPPGAAKEVRLFRGPLRMEHVSLGPWLQDSHFVSTVVALHEVAGVLYSLFRHPLSPAVGMVERTLGAYRVQLCCCGWWRSVLVDHMLPSTSSSLLFSCCADDLRKMWLPILEKAFAKMCGSYAAILNASSMAVMASLSGYPCVSLSSVWPTTGSNNNANNNARAFIDLLKEHLGEQGGLVILSTFTMAERGSPDSRLERTYKGLGLRPGHSVVVLGVEVVEGFVLLRLRQNDRSSSRPNNAWLGVWRKEQKPWAEAAGELSFALNDEGCLYMDAVDVPIYFSSGYCVYPFFNGREMRVRSEFIGSIPGICLRIDVKRTTRVAFCLQQCGEPCTAKEDDLSDGLPPEQTDAAIDLHLTGHTDGIQVFIRSSNRPNIFEPNYAKHLVEAQKVAMGAHLTPQHSPYFVIPRSDAVKELPYVLTLFAEDVDEDQSLSVEFVKIKGAAPVFRGGQASAVMLKPSTDCKSVAAEYQYRRCGTELIERGKSVSPYAQRY